MSAIFTIAVLSNKVVKASKLVDVESFVIVDASGELVGGTKAYDSREEAQAKIDSLGSLAEGLAFAKSAFTGMADKALIGKANTVAAYLDWVAGGRVDAPTKAEEKAEEAQEEPAAPVASEEETF
jgi:hypothetical protein